MTIWLFIILLSCAGMWCVCDGWFSLSLYLRNEDQSWHRDHYIRVIRILVGILLLYLAVVFGDTMIGG